MKHKIKKDSYIFKIFIFIQKYLKTSNVIFFLIVNILKNMLQKKILQNIFYVKKSKCSKKAHLWLNLLSLLVHLIMKKKGRRVLIDVGFVANFIYFPLQILRNRDCTHLPSSLIKEESSIHFWGRKLKFVK
jgi:hypothetical protein